MHTTTTTPQGKPCIARLFSESLQRLAFQAHHPHIVEHGTATISNNVSQLLAAKDTGATPFPRKS